MTRDEETPTAGRRDFLKLAGLGAVAGAASAIAGEEAKAEDGAGAAGKGYRETAHVRQFYETARF